MDQDHKATAAEVSAAEGRSDDSDAPARREPGTERQAKGGKADEGGSDEAGSKGPGQSKPKKRKKKKGPHPNNVRRIRIERMMSKAELARRANLSVLTIDRVEKGFGCRMDTKRKILEALDLSLADRVRVFGEEE